MGIHPDDHDGAGVRSTGVTGQSVFVAMPFAPEFDSVYRAIEAATTRTRTTPTRADRGQFAGGIRGRIDKLIHAAGMVVADITGGNQNVFLEIGLAQGTGKPVIYLDQGDFADAPFDVRGERIIRYANTKDGLKRLETELFNAIRGVLGVTHTTIAVCSRKGGVGKTTAVLNLAWAFADTGRQVLMVDLDPQASLTETALAGKNVPANRCTIQALTKGNDLASRVEDTAKPGVRILPSRWSDVQAPLHNPKALSNALESVAPDYDLVLIDTPAAIDGLLANALSAADYALVPTDLSAGDLHSLDHYLAYLRDHLTEFEFQILGVFASQLEPAAVAASLAEVRTKLTKILNKIPKIHWFKRTIRREDLVRRASLQGQAVSEMPGRKQVRTHYRHLAKEILERMGSGGP